MKKHATYRKFNDRSLNSSTYHKKDGTNIRAKLKKEAEDQIKDETSFELGEILGVDTDGCLILWDGEKKYNCGETPSEFGEESISEEEWETIKLSRLKIDN